ncbi:MAG: hypothetical protein HY915_10945, partial [Desulfovibrio sp.]|nr:hypothetical protein [Desulfovibrio sp.]
LQMRLLRTGTSAAVASVYDELVHELSNPLGALEINASLVTDLLASARTAVGDAQRAQTILTEANLVIRMARTVIFPAAMRYQGELAGTCANLKAIGHDFKMASLEDVTTKLRAMQAEVDKLEKLLAHEGGDTLAHAKFMCDKVLPAMSAVRSYADALESVVADDLWPLPSYQEMLFIR